MPLFARSGSESSAASEGRRRGAARRAALRVLFTAFPFRASILALLTLAQGILPAIFAFLVGRLVDRLPPAIASGPGSADGRLVVTTFAAIGLVLVTQELVGVASELVATGLRYRFEEHLLARTMRATLQVPRLDPFEDPDLAARADQATRIARYGPGELIGGVSTKWPKQAEGLAATVLVASVWPIAAVVLLPLWIVVSRFLQADFYRANPFWADPLRRAMYLKRLALMPEWAKELRIFGLTGWIVDRFGFHWASVMAELWRARRVGYRLMSVLGPVMIGTNLVVAVAAARAAMNGDLTAGALAVLVQGLFGMAALASQEGTFGWRTAPSPCPTSCGTSGRPPPACPRRAGTRGPPPACRPARSGSSRCASGIPAATRPCTTSST